MLIKKSGLILLVIGVVAAVVVYNYVFYGGKQHLKYVPTRFNI